LAPGYRIIAVDLPGHGKTPLPEDQEWPLTRLADSVAEFALALGIKQAIVLGYSMGGRVALHLVLQHPSLLSALVLIGASPGIADANERQARWERDCALVVKLRERGVEWFADFWEQQPIFQSQARLSAEKRALLHRLHLDNDAEHLAFALEQWSTGRQENLLPRLHEIRIPMLLLSGERDAKYCAVNEQMEQHAEHADVIRIAIPDAGHAAHFEQPESTARILNDFLERIRNRS
jgi:2-succinyl-6-hydroxy-2,4-cyclohexadiene-1-carboxylate synthase